MAIVSPLLMCMSLVVCSAPIITPKAVQGEEIPQELLAHKIKVPTMVNPNLSINQKKPFQLITPFPINRAIELPLLSKPEPLPAFSTEIELTPSSWPLRGTFNPLGMKLKLKMPL